MALLHSPAEVMFHFILLLPLMLLLVGRGIGLGTPCITIRTQEETLFCIGILFSGSMDFQGMKSEERVQKRINKQAAFVVLQDFPPFLVSINT